MPRLGMEPIRREALVKATIAEIGEAGTLDVTVNRIAKRAGMSSALAHHYFGGKDDIFLAAMRHVLTVYGAEVRGALIMAADPRSRVEAIIRASFSDTSFRQEVIAAWLNFYVMALSSAPAKRLLLIYQRRIRSNLCHGLRPLLGARAGGVAENIAALIDGGYLRQSLGQETVDGAKAIEIVMQYLDLELERGSA